jgi:hypothetical protein
VYDRHMSALHNYATPDPLYPIMVWSRWLGETIAEQFYRIKRPHKSAPQAIAAANSDGEQQRESQENRQDEVESSDMTLPATNSLTWRERLANWFGRQVVSTVQHLETLDVGAALLAEPDAKPTPPLSDVILAGAQAVIDWTGNYGRLNNLPHAKYAMTDDLITAFTQIDAVAAQKAVLYDHNPKPGSWFSWLGYKIFGRSRENGKAYFLRVQRSDHIIPYEEMYLSYESDVDAAKQLVKDIRRYLKKTGETQVVRAYLGAMKREPIVVIQPMPA